ncbi:MAG: hypothetical protein ACYS8I_15290 [Planctomycetota bacterium]|jgi:hypothetical protein
MKKVLIVVGIIILLILVFRSRAVHNRADRFIESNETHERKLIRDFLSQ